MSWFVRSDDLVGFVLSYLGCYGCFLPVALGSSLLWFVVVCLVVCGFLVGCGGGCVFFGLVLVVLWVGLVAVYG